MESLALFKKEKVKVHMNQKLNFHHKRPHMYVHSNNVAATILVGTLLGYLLQSRFHMMEQEYTCHMWQIKRIQFFKGRPPSRLSYRARSVITFDLKK